MNNRFSIVASKIEPLELYDLAAGAAVTFEGRVRNHNDGRPVGRLFYEAYDDLALSEGNRILAEAERRFRLHRIVAIHRVGQLELGDVAIWMQALASHRNEAFAACEWAMDAIKKSVPIWKREEYLEGEPTWLGDQEHKLELQRFDRQIKLPEIAADGQERIRQAKVLVVGAGGLGTPAIEYLARSGVGDITIVDPDDVSLSNLPRQITYTERDVGFSKVEVVTKRVNDIDVMISIKPIKARIDADNVDELVQGHDFVLDCTDDFGAKYLLNDACVLAGVPLITASIHRWQGQVLVVGDGPCLRCLMPSPPPGECVGTCEEEGVLGTVAGFFGVLQANEALKQILKMSSDLSSHFLAVDLRDFSTFKISRFLNPECPICNPEAKSRSESAIEISADELAELDCFAVVDLRKDKMRGCLTDFFPPNMIVDTVEESIRRNAERIVLVCQRGRTSLRRAYCLRDEGRENVFSLRGGVDQLLKGFDA